MPIGLKVAFSKKADCDFEDILTYIKADFGSRASIDFKILILKFVGLIASFPEMGSLEVAEKGIRGFVVHGRLKIFYRITDTKVIILRLFDTRQHPERKF
jgi:plasmid stabilization system protein ParE